MFAGTNFDYETSEVSDVYGPFKTEAEAIKRVRDHAQAEFDEVKAEFDDAKMIDELETNGFVEITFDDENENGCLYQVVEMTP
jgi:hypothetical protein